ncbi:hypothetical protein GGR92_003241 [Spirosoma lacussanchae]|uniref:hypothetical protein n=1 Tax=Spirosoma lacussanchae TaxID=1884249 RepID=UPI0011082245|nr:hypothetical protein [Spirosoma lacussanchae]
MISDIKSIADVQEFARQLVAEGLTGGFHPDDSFHDFVAANGSSLYTPEEAAVRNRLLEQCFEVCGDSVYEIIGRVTLRDTPFESIFDEDHQERYNTFMRLVELGVKNYRSNGIGSMSVREMVLAKYN